MFNVKLLKINCWQNYNAVLDHIAATAAVTVAVSVAATIRKKNNCNDNSNWTAVEVAVSGNDNLKRTSIVLPNVKETYVPTQPTIFYNNNNNFKSVILSFDTRRRASRICMFYEKYFCSSCCFCFCFWFRFWFCFCFWLHCFLVLDTHTSYMCVCCNCCLRFQQHQILTNSWYVVCIVAAGFCGQHVLPQKEKKKKQQQEWKWNEIKWKTAT